MIRGCPGWQWILTWNKGMPRRLESGVKVKDRAG
jgi:hypothetical protein